MNQSKDTGGWLGASLAGACMLIASGAIAEPAHAIPGKEALDYGFRFASAIETDPKDRSKAQQALVEDFAALGLIDEAIERAGAIDGWRRGVALADLATHMAQAGRQDEARAVLARAEEARQATQGWEGPRVQAHVAQAHAALGETEPSERMARELAANDPRQYAGRAAATEAAAHGMRGEFDEAMKRLGALEGENDLEVAWWRTVGYSGLARQKGLSLERRRTALDAARASATALPGWKQAEALQSLAEVYRDLGASGAARDVLAEAAQLVAALPESDELKTSLRSNLARAWARQGEKGRARDLLRAAEPGAARVLNLDRPAVYANLAWSWSVVGDSAEMWRLYDRALDEAEGLHNARPRALAIVDVCRSLGRNGIELSAPRRQRLERLLAGLEAPW